MRRGIWGVAVCLLIPAGMGLADDAATLAQQCVTCHGAEGEAIPPLAGLPEADVTAALLAYRAGERPDALMQVVAKRLSDDEIAALAAYFEGLGP
ncbi:c-type cytochrome [uncultured Paracoccus sp.]|uniref:c-type cytochrome n=1 Tax=uncultured Paracoccus sp. TaxID=189685 RepID=UPI00261F3A1B|nr:c-type cytochrome [uncultured Paracoccus sp.]